MQEQVRLIPLSARWCVSAVLDYAEMFHKVADLEPNAWRSKSVMVTMMGSRRLKMHVVRRFLTSNEACRSDFA